MDRSHNEDDVYENVLLEQTVLKFSQVKVMSNGMIKTIHCLTVIKIVFSHAWDTL